jgi:hypothetical protein
MHEIIAWLDSCACLPRHSSTEDISPRGGSLNYETRGGRPALVSSFAGCSRLFAVCVCLLQLRTHFLYASGKRFDLLLETRDGRFLFLVLAMLFEKLIE